MEVSEPVYFGIYASQEADVMFCLYEIWPKRFVTWDYIYFFSFYVNDLG